MSNPPPASDRLLAGPHNTRLGTAIHAFNLPAVPEICVGATPACEEACYAKGFLFRLQRERHLRNLERARDAGFAAAMIAEIRRGLVPVVRVHTSGDFFGAAYISAWRRVARACPGTAFFAYTRSWRAPDLPAELIDLARSPSVHLWFSEDRDSGRPPPVARVRRAYLLTAKECEAAVPGDADLVFRVPLPRRPGRPNAYARAVKWAGGVLICPKEQGVPRRVELTCSSWRICFSAPRHTPT